MIDLAGLRERALTQGQNPRVHPNGFIQLDLEPVAEGDQWDLETREEVERPTRGHSGAATRLHIWNPPGVELPHQKTVNEIHDHVFDMKSTVVIGELVQVLYKFEQLEGLVESFDVPLPGTALTRPRPVVATHELYQAVYSKSSSSRLEPTGKVGVINAYNQFPVRVGQSYTQPAFTFHDTLTPTGLCVTVMEKEKIHEGDAHVLVPIGTTPDNSYDRRTAMPEDEIWKVIAAVLP